jgi:ABC-type dipeptide/oligopeptide/nickel transport system permease component
MTLERSHALLWCSRLLTRVLAAAATVLVVALLTFLALRLLPGDPAELILGDQATPAARALLRAKLHLDEPMGRQALGFLRGLLHGRLGPSLRRPDRDAMALVLDALPTTAALAGVAVTLGGAFGVALALGAVATTRKWIKRSCVWALRLGSAVPLLAFAPSATWLLALRLRWVPLPADPDAGVRGLLYAAALLSLPLSAAVGRVAAAALAQAKAAPFLQVARAKGLDDARVWVLHALPNCAGPVITVLSAQLGALLGGAIVLERLLERRGLGTVVSDALATRDLPVIEASVVASATLFVLAQLLGTWLHGRVDPRAR